MDITAPVCLYLVSATLYPGSDSSTNLDDHLFAKRAPIFLLLALLMGIYSVQNWVLDGTGLTTEDLHRGGFIVGSLVLAVTGRRIVHWVVGIALFLEVVAFAVTFTPYVATSP